MRGEGDSEEYNVEKIVSPGVAPQCCTTRHSSSGFRYKSVSAAVSRYWFIDRAAPAQTKYRNRNTMCCVSCFSFIFLRATFKLLLRAFAVQGSSDGVINIMGDMKQTELPIDANTYNMLILALEHDG